MSKDYFLLAEDAITAYGKNDMVWFKECIDAMMEEEKRAKN